MSDLHVVTIITLNHYDKALTMLESMRKYRDCHLHLLIVNRIDEQLPESEHVTYYSPNDIFEGPLGVINRISYARYLTPVLPLPEIIEISDYMRWSLKAGFMRHVLQHHNMVIHADCDLHFYSDFSEIIEYASDKSITLSPHWRTIYNVATGESVFNFHHGLYNGGFIIVTKGSEPILDWWAEQCCIECSASGTLTYVDQRYLDLVPLYFDNVGIIQHKGCNVAAWNLSYLKREVIDNEVLVAGQKIIFIHFSPITIRYIKEKLDMLLTEHLTHYQADIMTQRMIIRRKQLLHLLSDVELPNYI